MSYEVEWLVLSFAIMVVAVLVNLHEKLERAAHLKAGVRVGHGVRR